MICQMEFIVDFLLFCVIIFILRILYRSRPLNTGLRKTSLKRVAGCNSVRRFTEKAVFFMMAKMFRKKLILSPFRSDTFLTDN